MHATAVKPPATADAAPVATVSLCSCPGSRRWTWMSIRPGVDDPAWLRSPYTSAPSAARFLLDARDHARPRSGRRTGRRARWRDRRLARSSAAASSAATDLYNGSSSRLPPESRYSTAMRTATPFDDLLENHGIRTVGDLRVDLDAAVHRPGCMTMTSSTGPPDPLRRHAEQREVLAHRRNEMRAACARAGCAAASRRPRPRPLHPPTSSAARRDARCPGESASPDRTPRRRRPWS